MEYKELMEKYPEIQWDQPMRLIGTDGIIRYACRLCFMEEIPRSMDLSVWPTEIALWAEHQVETHEIT